MLLATAKVSNLFSPTNILQKKSQLFTHNEVNRSGTYANLLLIPTSRSLKLERKIESHQQYSLQNYFFNWAKDVILHKSSYQEGKLCNNIILFSEYFNAMKNTLKREGRASKFSPMTQHDWINHYSMINHAKESTIEEASDNYSFFDFMEAIVSNLKELGQHRTSETYTSAMSSFRKFIGCKDLQFGELNSHTIQLYELHLKRKGLTMNTISFYMRILRAVYNRAVEAELTQQRYPFKRVYTGIDKTVKRAVSLETIRRIKQLDLHNNPRADVARDMFLFSFYTRGMSFVDMAFLRKSNLSDGTLSYRRRKTSQQLFIKWESCMQEIVNKHDTGKSQFLLPIIHHPHNERMQYINASHSINRHLKIIGHEIGLLIPLTMYVARHTWASIAHDKNIPISVISESMGHQSENTTRIYLNSLSNIIIDQANSLIINSIVI